MMFVVIQLCTRNMSGKPLTCLIAYSMDAIYNVVDSFNGCNIVP